MAFSLNDFFLSKLSRYLLSQKQLPERAYLSKFNVVCDKIRPADVLLVDGRSRASKIIRHVTQSSWSHAALYIGRLQDIKNQQVQNQIKLYVDCTPHQQLLIESEIGQGTIISPIEKYKDDHLRIMRPEWLVAEDVDKVIYFALEKLGRKYNIRHLLDLARFLLPWGCFPRKWRSSLFQNNALQPTEDICSSMIADAFQSVQYPILPLIQEGKNNQMELIKRNPRLFTPSDFDFSPFFSVIKYPVLPLGKKRGYAHLPWVKDNIE